MSEFRMPSLGADMEAGTLTDWFVKVGDPVHRGQIVAAVETQKGIIEIECFEDGVVESLLIEPGTRVPVGTPLARIEREPSTPDLQIEEPAAVVPVNGKDRARISPAARRLARELGVDPTRITGTGSHGAISRADVERAAKAAVSEASVEIAPEHPPLPEARVPSFEAMQRAIAAAMAKSKREIPHYYAATSIDLSRTTAWLEERNASASVEERILIDVPLLKAVALGLLAYPELNGYYAGDRFEQRAEIHLGVAISLRGGGLVAPAIHGADRMSLLELMSALRDLTTRCRAGRVRSSELSDPTVTVTLLGDRGVEEVTGVIYPPQVAIVGFGKVLRRPWAIGDAIAVRPIVRATLAADHRVSNGHRGSLFLSTVDRLLQEPEKL